MKKLCFLLSTLAMCTMIMVSCSNPAASTPPETTKTFTPIEAKYAGTWKCGTDTIVINADGAGGTYNGNAFTLDKRGEKIFVIVEGQADTEITELTTTGFKWNEKVFTREIPSLSTWISHDGEKNGEVITIGPEGTNGDYNGDKFTLTKKDGKITATIEEPAMKIEVTELTNNYIKLTSEGMQWTDKTFTQPTPIDEKYANTMWIGSKGSQIAINADKVRGCYIHGNSYPIFFALDGKDGKITVIAPGMTDAEITITSDKFDYAGENFTKLEPVIDPKYAGVWRNGSNTIIINPDGASGTYLDNGTPLASFTLVKNEGKIFVKVEGQDYGEITDLTDTTFVWQEKTFTKLQVE